MSGRALSPLTKRQLCDLWRIKWQALAIALLISAGVAVTVMAQSSQEALRAARDAYYSETRFAEVFARAARAPLAVTRQLAEIPGVTAVDARVVDGGLMTVPGLRRPVIAQLISLPERSEQALNRLVLTQGRLPAPGRPGEAVALRTFLEAAGVAVGDQLTAVVGGRRLEVTIVGAALSPEFVYVAAVGSAMPDDAHQAVLWLERTAVERVADMDGAFNSVALAVAPGANIEAVLAATDRILAPFGGSPAVTRADQPSNAFLEAEFKELSTSSLIFPPIFLIVAAALVHMVVSRLVDVDREQIGLLKAFGYTDAEAAAPYLIMAGVIGLLGAFGGGLLGAAFGAAITDLYAKYMRFPELAQRFHLGAYTSASLGAIGAALAGAAMSARRAIRLAPSVAMRPPSPARFRHGLLDQVMAAIHATQPARIVIRNLARRPLRSGLTVIGLSASIALLLSTQFIYDALDQVMDHSFYRVQRSSHLLVFAEPRDVGALDAVRRLPGVLAAEPFRTAAATLRSPAHTERMALNGYEPAALMVQTLDNTGAPAPLLSHGLVVSEALGKRLGVAPGQPVQVEVTEGRRPHAQLLVTAFAHDFTGMSAAIDRRALNRLMGEGDLASGAMVIVDPAAIDRFYAAVAETPGIVSVSSRDDTVASYRTVMTDAFRTTITFYVCFAGAIAFGVAYNAARISFAEQARDLATLEVLGFTHAETAQIQLGELALLALAAIPLGIGLGWLLANGIAAAYGRDEMRLPALITGRGIGVALLMFFAAIGVTAALIGDRLRRLDLVAVLKTRE